MIEIKLIFIVFSSFLGTEGVEALSHAISQDSCNVKVVNLRMNNIGDRGAQYLLHALSARRSKIKTLIISGCGITGESSFSKLLGHNNTLETLDISNNRIGEVRNINRRCTSF